jgi:hypothetical protein
MMAIKDDSRLANALTWAMLAVGVLVRLRHYLHNKSLWLDEAMLAHNVMDRDYAGLAQPLDQQQMAPLGFLYVSKWVGSLAGYHEMALRFWPLVASLLSLWLVWRLMRALAPSAWETLAVVALFALSFRLAYFASEFKQYSSDVFWALACFWAYHPATLLDRGYGRLLALALVGAVGVWFSHPLIFGLAGLGFYQGYLLLTGFSLARAVKLVVVGGAWLASFAAEYGLILAKDAANRAGMSTYWQDAFLPFPPRSQADLATYLNLPQELFYGTLGINGLGWLLMFVALAGAVALWEQGRHWAIGLVAPLLLLVLASALKVYPLSGRLVLFLTPSLAILLGVGLVFVAQRLRQQRLAGLLLALVLVQPLAITAGHLFRPAEEEEVKPLLKHYEQHAQAGDVFYIHCGGSNAVKYYQAIGYVRLPGRVVFCTLDRAEPLRGIRADLAQLRAAAPPRIWVLYSHTLGGEDAYINQDLGQAKKGRLAKESKGAALYVFE